MARTKQRRDRPREDGGAEAADGPRPEQETYGPDDDFKWIGAASKGRQGLLEFEGFHQNGEDYRKGDPIFCLPAEEDEPMYLGRMIKCWFDPAGEGKERRRIQVNWYMQHADLHKTKKKGRSDRELYETNAKDDNSCCTIEGKLRVFRCDTEEEVLSLAGVSAFEEDDSVYFCNSRFEQKGSKGVFLKLKDQAGTKRKNPSAAGPPAKKRADNASKAGAGAAAMPSAAPASAATNGGGGKGSEGRKAVANPSSASAVAANADGGDAVPTGEVVRKAPVAGGSEATGAGGAGTSAPVAKPQAKRKARQQAKRKARQQAKQAPVAPANGNGTQPPPPPDAAAAAHAEELQENVRSWSRVGGRESAPSPPVQPPAAAPAPTAPPPAPAPAPAVAPPPVEEPAPPPPPPPVEEAPPPVPPPAPAPVSLPAPVIAEAAYMGPPAAAHQNHGVAAAAPVAALSPPSAAAGGEDVASVFEGMKQGLQADGVLPPSDPPTDAEDEQESEEESSSEEEEAEAPDPMDVDDQAARAPPPQPQPSPPPPIRASYGGAESGVVLGQPRPQAYVSLREMRQKRRRQSAPAALPAPPAAALAAAGSSAATAPPPVAAAPTEPSATAAPTEPSARPGAPAIDPAVTASDAAARMLQVAPGWNDAVFVRPVDVVHAAILAMGGRATVQQILNFTEAHGRILFCKDGYEYRKLTEITNWRQTIRNKLSSNKRFVKVGLDGSRVPDVEPKSRGGSKSRTKLEEYAWEIARDNSAIPSVVTIAETRERRAQLADVRGGGEERAVDEGEETEDDEPARVAAAAAHGGGRGGSDDLRDKEMVSNEDPGAEAGPSGTAGAGRGSAGGGPPAAAAAAGARDGGRPAGGVRYQDDEPSTSGRPVGGAAAGAARGGRAVGMATARRDDAPGSDGIPVARKWHEAVCGDVLAILDPLLVMVSDHAVPPAASPAGGDDESLRTSVHSQRIETLMESVSLCMDRLQRLTRHTVAVLGPPGARKQSLVNWLMHHSMVEDAEYGNMLRDGGGAPAELVSFTPRESPPPPLAGEPAAPAPPAASEEPIRYRPDAPPALSPSARRRKFYLVPDFEGGDGDPPVSVPVRLRWGSRVRVVLEYESEDAVRTELTKLRKAAAAARCRVAMAGDEGGEAGAGEDEDGEDLGRALAMLGMPHDRRPADVKDEDIMLPESARKRMGSSVAFTSKRSRGPMQLASHLEDARGVLQKELLAAGACWGLVQDVVLEVPCRLLRDGMELVHLPGVGPDAAHPQLAVQHTERALSTASAVIVVHGEEDTVGSQLAQLLADSSVARSLRGEAYADSTVGAAVGSGAAGGGEASGPRPTEVRVLLALTADDARERGGGAGDGGGDGGGAEANDGGGGGIKRDVALKAKGAHEAGQGAAQGALEDLEGVFWGAQGRPEGDDVASPIQALCVYPTWHERGALSFRESRLGELARLLSELQPLGGRAEARVATEDAISAASCFKSYVLGLVKLRKVPKQILFDMCKQLRKIGKSIREHLARGSPDAAQKSMPAQLETWRGELAGSLVAQVRKMLSAAQEESCSEERLDERLRALADHWGVELERVEEAMFAEGAGGDGSFRGARLVDVVLAGSWPVGRDAVTQNLFSLLRREASLEPRAEDANPTLNTYVSMVYSKYVNDFPENERVWRNFLNGQVTDVVLAVKVILARQSASLNEMLQGLGPLLREETAAALREVFGESGGGEDGEPGGGAPSAAARREQLKHRLGEVLDRARARVTEKLEPQVSSLLERESCQAIGELLEEYADRLGRMDSSELDQRLGGGCVHHCVVDFRRVRVLITRLQRLLATSLGSKAAAKGAKDDGADEEDDEDVMALDPQTVWQLGEYRALLEEVRKATEEGPKGAYITTCFSHKEFGDFATRVHQENPRANHGHARGARAVTNQLRMLRKMLGKDPDDLVKAIQIFSDPAANEYPGYRIPEPAGSDKAMDEARVVAEGWADREVHFILLQVKSHYEVTHGHHTPPTLVPLPAAVVTRMTSALRAEARTDIGGGRAAPRSEAEVSLLLAALCTLWGASKQGFYEAQRMYSAASDIGVGAGMVGTSCTARERAICQGISFCERVCTAPGRFSRWGSDLLVTMHFFAMVSTGAVKALSLQYHRRAMERWKRENDRVPDGAGSEDILFLVEGIYAMEQRGSNLPDLRADVELAAKAWRTQDYLGISCAPGSTTRLPVRDGRVSYEKVSNALIWAFFFDGVGIRLEGGSLEDVFRVVQESVRPYCSEVKLGLTGFKNQCYLATHVVYVKTRWCQVRVDPSGPLQEEYHLIKTSLPRLMELEDVELVGEMVQALKCFGHTEKDEIIARAVDFLLGAQDRLSGSWGDRDSYEAQYHTTVCALGACIEHVYVDH